MESEFLNLTGLWKQTMKDGKTTYLSGSIGPGINLLVFPNTKKRPNSNDPDYRVCLAPKEPKEKPKQQPEDDLPF